MHRFSVWQVCWLASLALDKKAYATLQGTFPVDAQLPPVAYASQPFEFTFLPNTFTGGSSQISYIVSNAPAWLSLDSATRTFSGTPTANDVGAPKFELTAFDQTGQASSDVTLIVLEQEDLSTGSEDILSQLAEAGNVSAPATLLLYPQQSFQFSLASTLFDGVSTNTVFYALSSDGSPLPSWVQFDPTEIHFSGTTPPLLSQSPSQQAYSFKLAASNIVGYSEVSVSFQILIGDHHIAFTKPLFSYSVTGGTYLQTPSLLVDLEYDGLAIRRDQIASADASAPGWLIFNETNLSFSGHVPNGASSQFFSLTVDGIDANSANATIAVHVDEYQNTLEENLGNVSANAGSYFSYVVVRPSGFGTNTNITANSTNFPSWLSFTAANLTLQGFVPTDTTPEADLISFLFSNDTHSIIAVLTINVTRPTASSTSGESGAFNPLATANSTAVDNERTSSNRRLKILVPAIVLPVVLTILLLVTVGCHIRRRKDQQDKSRKENKPEPISQLPVREVTSPEIEDVPIIRDAVLPYKSEFQEQNSAPRVELLWPPDSLKRTRNRLSKRRRISHNSIVGSSWDDLVDYRTRSVDSLRSKQFSIFKDRKELDAAAALRSHAPQVPRNAPARPARPASLFSRRSSDLLGTLILGGKNVTRPNNAPNRLSGAGHGAGSQIHKAGTDFRSSWQTTLGTIPATDNLSGTVASTVFSKTQSREIVRPTMEAKNELQDRHAYEHQTLRFVNSDSGKSESFGVARQNFYVQRTRDRLEGTARFSNAASRISSGPRSNSMTGAVDEAHPDRLRMGTDKTPPIPQKSEARRVTSQTNPREYRRQTIAHPSMPERESSMASSHQFDSAKSSVSLWEDENTSEQVNTVKSPPKPLETSLSGDPTSAPAHRPQVQDKIEHQRPPSSHWPQLADQRRHVNLEDTRLQRSERSHKGSLRFV